MNQMRQTILSDLEMTASKQRFALFSQPPPLAIGDDSIFRQKIIPRGADSKPQSLPRNMLPGPNRSGVTRKSFIGYPDSIYVGDKYNDPEKVEREYFKQLHTRAKFHQSQFKPSSGPSTLTVSSYKFIDQNPRQKLKPARDSTGKVITQQKNVTTNPMTKIQKEVFKNPKYISDPYERKDLIESKQRKEVKQKMPPEMFRSMSHGDIMFSAGKDIYGIDNKAQQIMKSKNPFNISQPRSVGHQAKFKLARRGHGDPLGKYPEFIMPKTSNSQIVKTIRKQKDEKQQWKPNGNKSLSRPTPSISFSSTNLRRCM